MIDLKSGQKLGGWTIDHVLAFGEPALVAAHRTDNPSRKATLRVATPTSKMRASMAREMAALQSFDDPRIPRPIEHGSDETCTFLALRAFSGDSLSDRLVAGHRDWRQSCRWLYPIAKSLQHIHERGWVHREIHPQSIYVGPNDDLYLMGFDTAVHSDTGAELEHLQTRNMAYVAPEVLRDPNYHAERADLYSFGLVAYELLCGEPAFPAAAWAERADRERTLLEWKTRAAALDPGPEVPGWLRSMIRKCTHPLSEQRLPDMDSVVAWLEASQPSWEKTAPPPVASYLPPEQLPELEVRPTMIDAAMLADVIAARTAHLQRDRSREDFFYIFTSGVMGSGVGVAIAALVAVFVELSRV